MQFMLDTDTCSDIIKCIPAVTEKANRNRGLWCVSVIVYQELVAGLIGSKGTRHEHAYEWFLRTVEVIDFSKADALAAADIGEANKRKGHNIGFADNQIAGHAASCGLTLVTNNLKHFKPIRGLNVVSWL